MNKATYEMVEAVKGYRRGKTQGQPLSNLAAVPYLALWLYFTYSVLIRGLANLVGSFFKSFPVSGSFSRSAVIFQAGAKTCMSNIISACFVIATLFGSSPQLATGPVAIVSFLTFTSLTRWPLP